MLGPTGLIADDAVAAFFTRRNIGCSWRLWIPQAVCRVRRLDHAVPARNGQESITSGRCFTADRRFSRDAGHAGHGSHGTRITRITVLTGRGSHGSWVLRGWRNAERAIDDFDEVSFFAEDESLRLCHGEIRARLWIRFETRPVGFIGRQAVKRDQPPRDVVCAFVREKVPDQVAAATRNDAAPVPGVLLEGVSLKRINLVADDAGDCHGGPSLNVVRRARFV